MPSYEEVTQRAGSLRSMTGLTKTEFLALLPHFEQAFVVYMQDRTIDGQPRTSRRSLPERSHDSPRPWTHCRPISALHWQGRSSSLSDFIIGVTITVFARQGVAPIISRFALSALAYSWFATPTNLS
jgi:hypothetical protein